MKTTTRILLVDDEPTLRGLIAHRLGRNYDVVEAASGEEAVQCLLRDPFDLVISDVDMPGMSGPQVIAEARRLYPSTKAALMTGQSMGDCIRFALESDIGSIIAKTIPFDLEELARIVKGILTEDVFGLEKYLLPEANLTEYRVCASSLINRVRDKVLQQPALQSWPQQRKYALRLALDESITNAAYHGNKIPKGKTFSFSRDQEVEVIYGEDKDKIGIAVVDQAGELDKKTILGKLDSCMRKDDEALYQDSGRGLFLILSIVHRLIINIRKGDRTEIIMIFRPNHREIGHRPIIINEL